MTIPALAASAAARFGDRPAVVDSTTRLTYAELQQAANSFAAALVSAGIDPGDRVAIWAPNSAEWIISFLGLSTAGATLVPINTRFKGNEAAEILLRSGARVLVTVTDFLGTDYVAAVRRSGTELPGLDTVIVARGPTVAGTVGFDEFVACDEPHAVAEAARRSVAVSPDDIADIMFTSGTTGTPKGVVNTHRSTVHVATDWAAMTELCTDDRYLMINPYFHMFGLKAGILACVAAGATMYPEAVFDIDRVIERVAAERITVLPGPPTLYQSLLDHPERTDDGLSSLRIAVTGAADIPVTLIGRIADELPFRAIIAGYGLTEAGTVVATSPDDDVEVIATTVGRPRPGFELRLVGRDGADVDAGEQGEILVRGASVMSHYLDDPGATETALSADGWLLTGDLGAFDAAGNLQIVGRSKDMFIVGGFNAYPAEIENALLRHPDIQQAAVIGVPDDRLGEVGMAFVVRKPGSDLSGDAVVSWARDEMANYKAPRRVEIIDELPVNATGKVVKDELRRRASHDQRLI